MPSWGDFAKANPALADFGVARIKGRVSFLATIRPDGGPRVHPVAPFFQNGHLYVYMEPTSPKGKDLQRDPRYALHCAVEDTNGGNGEFYVRGQAQLIREPAQRATIFQIARGLGYHPKDRYIIFELEVQQASSLVYQGNEIVRDHWNASELS